MSSEQSELPDIAEVLGRVLQRVASEHVPLLLAIAERMAAERYRGWASTTADPGRAAAFHACAAREEEIARRVEALFPDAAALRDRILGENPDLEEINRSLFAGRPVAQQLVLQARGERLGSATWRALAARAESEAARDVLASCAFLEEESADFLESLDEGG